MKAFGAFVAYLFGCLLASALLLPLLHPPLAAAIGDSATPSRVLYRFATLLMLLGFPWFLKSQGLWSWRRIGFTLPARAAWAALGRGLVVGGAMLGVLVAALLALGVRFHAPSDPVSTGWLLELALSAVLGGLLVGLIEEVFFRGMMHTAMRRTLAFWPTALLTGGFYAALHFVRPEDLPPGTAVDLDASFGMLRAGFERLADVGRFGDSFVALLVAGILLSMVRERGGHVLTAIGIHAGWVAVIKTTKALTDTDLSDGLPAWIGHYDHVTGWLAAAWLGVLAAAYWLHARRN